eukprot:XP_028355054.1 zinc finger protein 490-like [Physeter catodon]
MVSVGKTWEDHDIGDQYKNHGGNLRSSMVERLSERKDSSPCGENFILIPSLNFKKKTTGLKPCECSACGKVFMDHSSLIRHMKCHIEHEPGEFQKYGDKLYKWPLKIAVWCLLGFTYWPWVTVSGYP